MIKMRYRIWDLENEQYSHDDEYDIKNALWKDISNEDFFKLEQFTGLKDKNGVDIYAGDIVKFEDTAYCDEYGSEICDVEQVAQVIYDKYKGFIVSNFQFKDSDLAYEFDEVWYNMDLETFWSRVEIIGNINENKELLK